MLGLCSCCLYRAAATELSVPGVAAIPPVNTETLVALATENRLLLQAIDLMPGVAWAPLRRTLLVLYGQQQLADGQFQDAAATFMAAVPPAR